MLNSVNSVIAVVITFVVAKLTLKTDVSFSVFAFLQKHLQMIVAP